jgi:PAS domain S-box-containing protein
MFCCPCPIWFRHCSIVILLLSVGFLYVSLFAYNYSSIFAASLVPSLLVALSFAIFLNIYSLCYLQKENREADRAFHDADREFSSIFQNVLDAILIIDDNGDCLDANPAATDILQVSGNKLIGQNISRFLLDRDEFIRLWSSFSGRSIRGRTQLITGNRTTLFVDFTATANYLPGRHMVILCDVTKRTHAELALRKSEERFQLMASNIQEIFWMLDAHTLEVTYINPAYTAVTGHDVGSLQKNPTSYRELIHPEDRIRVLSRLQELANSGTLDEEFRFIRADGQVRWVWAKGVLVLTRDGTYWLVGTGQDITSRKQAEMKITEQLDVVEAARAETEALRKSTLALSQNLAMDSVLDTLLRCVAELVPFDRATIIFVEEGSELMVAREAPRNMPKRIGLTFSADGNHCLQRVLFEKRAILLQDVAKESGWRDMQPLEHLHSWLGVPLLAAGRVLGIMSLGMHSPRAFTAEHLRIAKSLAVPAAVAIQNARVHERAEIYAAELELRLRQLREAQNALQHASSERSN